MGSPLYVNAKGQEVNTGSYSAAAEFRFCRRKFKLHRILGWHEKNRKASLEMGKVFESAIEFYHSNGLKPGDCVSEVKRLWLKFAEVEMDYTDQEENWNVAYGMLSAWARLYEIRLPSWPIRNPKFQLNYRKKLWPGTNLADLEWQAYIDMLSTLEDGTRIVVDIKTAKSSLDPDPKFLSLDPQLKKYSWVTGCPDVAFLWAVKGKPSYKKRDTVSLLEDIGELKAGSELSVFKLLEDGNLLLGTPESVQKMDEILDGISGKGSTERKANATSLAITEGLLLSTSPDNVTRCRLQFVQTRIPIEEWPSIGTQVGHELLSISQSAKDDFFPQDGEVRGTNAICKWCNFRGLCLKDDRLRDELLVQISSAPKERDWLEELEQEAGND